MSNGPVVDCTNRTCGFGIDNDAGCTDGESCSGAVMLRADTSPFHDATLQQASQDIQAVLNTIPKDPSGRQLSFLHTPMGTMLAWVRHDLHVPSNAIRASSPKAKLEKALKLK